MKKEKERKERRRERKREKEGKRESLQEKGGSIYLFQNKSLWTAKGFEI